MTSQILNDELGFEMFYELLTSFFQRNGVTTDALADQRQDVISAVNPRNDPLTAKVELLISASAQLTSGFSDDALAAVTPAND